MRVLLASNASYDPPRGGSTRSNLTWLRHLVRAGHVCRVVCASAGGDAETSPDGIAIRSVRQLSQRTPVLGEEIRAFRPDWVLVSSEDLSHVLLHEAERDAADRIVYLAHTPQWFPFGPESWNPDRRSAEIVRRACAVVTIGRHVAAYVEQHAQVKARVIHPPIYGRPPFRECGRFENPLVLMVNPCRVKGIEIFLALAGRLPDLEFAGLTGWGTTSADRDAIGRLPNARLLGTVPDIEEALDQARVLLMPSLWYEGFGLIAMEAMLRGVPVIASDSGGLVEAKAGTGYVIPVKPVIRYRPEFDEVHMPVAETPPQDIEPWVDSLLRLTADRAAWSEESRLSRTVAGEFVSRLDGAEFARLLEELQPSPPAPVPPHHLKSISELTPSQRALLLQRRIRRGIP